MNAEPCPLANRLTQLISQSASLTELQGLQITQINLTDATCPWVSCLLPFHQGQIRYGNTIAGPIIMGLADAAMYALMVALDEKNLSSVTRDFQVHFLSRPLPQALEARAYLIKDSSRHTLMRVDILSGEKLVAHVTGSYTKI